ncbi:MAG: excinuclease ABC subunit C [Candidatus Moranbacteria bacterium CG10_big_fil_rev_8_21_14_0_10_35_21]|nr:MAG: excinuclease ABC subunit C [Candidatus Moranbacteria bacterium CG10_big_fil_rev_8_21_14_0_10_35_21]PJA88882.1 MAG: excinuclease ABC subunit C [Candidatus Moranbacteria bacterium CG_4_9_14_3_um_filter_36_9]
MRQYCVYILSSISKVLYIGVTNDLKRRIYQHKHKVVDGFTKKYNVDKLVYFEQTENVRSALEREKQLKKWRREKKVNLINKINPEWKDLYKTL